MPTLEEATQSLRELLLKKSVMRGDFTLASGAKSDLYVDCRMTTLDAAGACLVGQVMHALLRKAEEETGVRSTSRASYRSARFFIQRTPNKSAIPTNARFRNPYLAVPANRCECLTGSSRTV